MANQDSQQTNKFKKPEALEGEPEIVESIAEIGAGTLAGGVKVATSLASLGLDLGAGLANAISENTVSEKTLTSWQETLDVSDEIADALLVDKNSSTFKMAESISQGIGTAAQILSGVGAVKAVTNPSLVGKVAAFGKGLVGQGSVKAGNAAVQSGSTAAKVAKGAGVGAAEEFLAQGSADQEGGALTTMADMLGMFPKKDMDNIDLVNREYMKGIQRMSPDLANEIDLYSSENPKKEGDSLQRLKNRARAALEGLGLGAGIETAIEGIATIAKATKFAKYNHNVAQDAVNIDEAVDKDILKAQDAGKEVTPEMKKSFFEKRKAEVKEARNKVQDPDGTVRPVDEKYLKDADKYSKLEEQIAKGQTDTFKKVQEKVDLGVKLNKNEKKAFLEEAQRLFKFNGTNRKAFNDLADLDDTKIDEIFSNPSLFSDLAEQSSKARSTLNTAKKDIMADQADIIGKQRDGTAKAEDLLIFQRQQELLRNIELQEQAAGSFAGQALASIKFGKDTSMSRISRMTESFRRRNSLDAKHPEYLDYQEKLLRDEGFRKEQFDLLDKEQSGTKSLILNLEQKGFDMYRKNLLLGTAGLGRNFVEGVVLSAGKVGRDTLQEGLSIFSKKPLKVGASASHFARAFFTEQKHSFDAMKAAWQGKDLHAMAKFGISKLEKEGSPQSMTMLQKVMSSGQRAITAGDAYITTINRTHFIGKESAYMAADMVKKEDTLKGIVASARNGEALPADALELTKELNKNGISIEKAIKQYDDVNGDMGEFANWYEQELKNSPSLDAAAKKHTDSISMNSDTSDLGALAQGFDSKGFGTISKTPFTRWFAPFPKPALTALDTVIEFTPILNTGRNLKKLRSGDPRLQTEALANLGMSYSVAGGMYSLLNSGLISGGGPKDPNDFKAWSAAGNKPYHLQMPDGSQLSLRGSVLGQTLAMVSDIRDMHTQMGDGSVEDEKWYNHAMTAAMAIMSDVSVDFWSDSIGNLYKAIDPSAPDKVRQGARAQLIKTAGFKTIPIVGATATSDLAKTLDSGKKDTSTLESGASGLMERTWNEIKASIPVISRSVPTKYSFITGEKMKHGKVGFTPLTFFGSTPQGAAVGNYMDKLLTSYGEKTAATKLNNLRFTLPTKTVNVEGLKKRYQLNSTEYAEISQIIANPEGVPPLMDALERISNQMPLDSMRTQEDKDLAVMRIKDTIGKYKKLGRDQWRRQSEDYRAFVIDERQQELTRRQKAISFDF